MSGQFFVRLKDYYRDVSSVLRGEAQAASIFPNSTDIGISRERVYAEFLKQHAPSKCNVFFGGFLFGDDGSESGQLDVLVTTDTSPRFNFHNKDDQGKSFSPVEGTLAVASIKSMLNKSELEDALSGFSAIPATSSLEKRLTFGMSVQGYDDWPYKILYASNGINADTLLGHVEDFYTRNPNIPVGRRPNIIHVSGKCAILRAVDGMRIWDANLQQHKSVQMGTFLSIKSNPDLHGITWVLDALQVRALASTYILFYYGGIKDKVLLASLQP